MFSGGIKSEHWSEKCSSLNEEYIRIEFGENSSVGQGNTLESKG